MFIDFIDFKDFLAFLLIFICMLTLGSVRRWTECIAARVRERARAAARASERARHAIACTHGFPLGNDIDRMYSLFFIRK